MSKMLRNATFILLFLFSTSFADGFEFSAAYTADILTVASGGLSTGTEYLDNLDLELDVDVADALNAGSGRLYIHGLYNNGTTFSANRVGDLQAVSNIDTAEAWRLFEFWYEFDAEHWSIKTGLYDLNSEFDVNQAGGIFMNSSHGIGAEFAQTGHNGPSIFPVSSLSLRAAMKFESATARVAILDGVPGDPRNSASNKIDLNSEDGTLTVAEIDVPYAGSARLWLGYWRYSAAYEWVNDTGSGHGNDGWYVGTESEFRIGSRAASWFVRFGQADERYNRLSSYVGTGTVIVGAIERRPNDRLGLAFASARAGDSYRDAIRLMGERASRRETIWELTYQVQVNERIIIQPDLQYVRNPSASSAVADAWVVGCRFQFSF